MKKTYFCVFLLVISIFASLLGGCATEGMSQYVPSETATHDAFPTPSDSKLVYPSEEDDEILTSDDMLSAFKHNFPETVILDYQFGDINDDGRTDLAILYSKTEKNQIIASNSFAIWMAGSACYGFSIGSADSVQFLRGTLSIGGNDIVLVDYYQNTKRKIYSNEIFYTIVDNEPYFKITTTETQNAEEEKK